MHPTIPGIAILALVRVPRACRSWFARWRDRRRLAAIAAKDTSVAQEDWPFPPLHLRKRVHGHEGLGGFVSVGRQLASDIPDAINGIVNLGQHSRVLDFGCGCGRVIRYLHGAAPQCQFDASDIDPEAIDWCRQHLTGLAQFVRNEELPPLPFADDTFDFVYSISVFTHLPEDRQFIWLDELKRVTRPGGHLLLSTHGEGIFDAALPQQRGRLSKLGFHYLVGPATDGLPGYYQTAFHAHDYIREQWGRRFEVTKIIAKSIGKHQDLVLCRKLLSAACARAD